MEMAYINVAEWSPEHVAEWLRGLEYSLVPYVQFFLNNKIDGCHLLNLTADDLEELHIFKIGHQLLILEAVELLRQLHYSLNSETLQSLAVKLGCKARSLYNDLKLNGPQDHSESMKQERITTSVLSAVSEILTSVKAFVSWLDRLPFLHDSVCLKLKKTVLKLSIELASTTQRDQFAERPHSLIKKNSLHIAELCDKFVQDSKDSLILQPASLDIALIKKKPDEELGIHIKSTYSGVHIIGGIKDQTPAKSCNKVEKGDEIVQVNYQTVIGWQQKKLVTAMTEHSMELHLTLKKRPRHINILGEVIILRPYRIPSKKTVNKCHKWSDDNRLCCPDTCSTSNESECLRDDFNEDEDDSAFLPASANHLILNDPSLQLRLYSGPSMATVQRRATVSGASPTILKPPVNIEDLVNGVPNVKTNDNFVRSISYDPSGSKFNSKFGSVFSKNVNCIEPCKNNPNKEKKETPDKSADQPAVETEAVTDFNPPSMIYSYDTCSSNDINPALVLETLPVHEEEYTVLENKSLNKVDDYLVLQKELSTNFITHEKEKHYSSAEAKESCTVPSNIDITAAKHNIILYDWEGVDTEFCGRRPSAHDISNEIAGIKASEINPVLLRRASKLETSPMNTDTSQEKHIGDIGNYQVVVIAGVPQRCVPSSKEGKEKNKGFELSSHQHRVKDSFVGKFSSRRISCKDLGKGDCEGWLYKLKERKGFFPTGHHWVKRWIVLKDHFLYSYKDEDFQLQDIKAESLISLPGSTVSPTTECKTKKFVFKVSQYQVTFFFATESQKDLANWMNKMGLAAIAYDASADITTSSFTKPAIILGVANNFYSETEDSENGSPTCIRRTLENDKKTIDLSSSEFPSEFVASSRRKNKTLSFSNRVVTSSSGFPKIKKRYSNKQESYNYELQAEEIVERGGPRSINAKLYYSSQTESHLKPGSRYLDYQNAKVSYNRSFSCTESYQRNQNNSIDKRSFEGSLNNHNFYPEKYGQTSNSNIVSCNSSVWNSVDEEHDMSTSSLGRQQKPLAKEITPGLVARMAVSYSNLSQRNSSVAANLNKKSLLNKGIPAPGYVAKISDSFDHLAKTGSARTDKGKKFSPISPTNEKVKVQLHQNYKYKRSASESHMSKNISECNVELSNTATSLTRDPHLSHQLSNKTRSEKYVSLLDKEYNKVFEGKKVSQQYLKSPCHSNEFSDLGSNRRMMRFFPSGNIIESTRSLVDVQNENLRESGNKLQFSANGKNASGSDIMLRDSKSSFTTESSFSLSGERYNSFRKTTSSSGSHLSNVFTSSEGIENIGFSCIDQTNSDNTDFRTHESKCWEQKHLTNSPLTYQASEQNINLPNESDHDSPKSSFKFFSSPKFMKKLTSPKLDKKNIFKSKKQAKEMKKAEQKESLSHSDRKFLGSPILARALFRSPKTEKKITTVSSGVQTDNPISDQMFFDRSKPSHDLNRNENAAAKELCCSTESNVDSREEENVTSKSSSCSSLNSITSNSVLPLTSSVYYVEARIKPQITVSLPLVTERGAESRLSPSDVSRTPLKPMMGVSMLSKKRLPSISGESSISVSSKSSQDGSTKEGTQLHSEVSIEVNGGDEKNKANDIVQTISMSTDDGAISSLEKVENCNDSS
ncbi:connector enhancer of kinase suppressor of ras 2 [Caerostris darwini]|uniref:Connector enhancer of kinase suppressor of ras 2 n=1 Tax=Caerostris darwini TaxID=1538125 RepID=A0AAV4P851_9ARAC|nr:connector enhancer of kinase suppressor of ras 2 [Caerostris darwini]